MQGKKDVLLVGFGAVGVICACFFVPLPPHNSDIIFLAHFIIVYASCFSCYVPLLSRALDRVLPIRLLLPDANILQRSQRARVAVVARSNYEAVNSPCRLPMLHVSEKLK